MKSQHLVLVFMVSHFTCTSTGRNKQIIKDSKSHHIANTGSKIKLLQETFDNANPKKHFDNASKFTHSMDRILNPNHIGVPYKIDISQRKAGRLYSYIKGLTQEGSQNTEESESKVTNKNPRVVVVEDSPGWGWDKEKKHGDDHHDKGGGGLTVLDALLAALSLISFGAFLINLLASLLQAFGFGFFTTTATYPVTGTTTGGTITTTGAASGVVNRISSYLRNNLPNKVKKKKKKGKIQATLGGTKGNIFETGYSTGNVNSEEFNDFDTEDLESSIEDDMLLSSKSNPIVKQKRKKRTVWQPHVHPYTALDIAARNILNSIASSQTKYQCMGRIICDSNRHARVIGNGLEYFTPIYTFSTSYFGHKLGLHQNFQEHLSAIFLGVQDFNYCSSNFPQCSNTA